jgi:hypothetical protein
MINKKKSQSPLGLVVAILASVATTSGLFAIES